MELDPLFVRGLRLLHSRAADSTDQLRSLFEEIKNRSSRGAASSGNGGKGSPANMSPRSTPSLQSRPSDTSHKRPFSKYRDDVSDATAAKKMHLDQSSLSSGVVRSSSYPCSPTIARYSDTSDLNDTAGLEMDFMDQLACIVCRNFGVTTGNQLKECGKCGALYHQDCHQPPISDAEHSDTRSVWHCYKCRSAAPFCTSGRVVAKTTTLSSSSSASSSSTSSSKIGPYSAQSKMERGRSDSSMHRKNYSKSVTSSSARPAGGSTMTSSSSFSTGGRSTGGGGVPAPPPNSMVSAERRMQLMKKKAAAKLNEKRKP